MMGKFHLFISLHLAHLVRTYLILVNEKVLLEVNLVYFIMQYELFLGPPRVGKTHLSIGRRFRMDTRYHLFQWGELVPLLKTEEYLRKSQIQLNRIRKADLVSIDDLMFLVMDHHEANLFFHLINHLYERCSVI